MDTKKTTDIYLAAAILALGGTYEGVNRTDPRHMEFELSLTPKFQSDVLASALPSLDSYEKEWANGTLMINAVAFKDAIQRMKSIIHTKV